MEAISFLLPPFIMCLILVGIHCYLGLHVLRRGVIFIDLSLAQVASLGSCVALLFHLEQNTMASYFVSLGFTFTAALYFSFAKRYEKFVSQEVMIALVYAFASAMVILVVNMMTHGAEHIKEILVGKILWVSWADVIKTAVIYSFVAIVHFVYRREILKSSIGKNSSILWDFLFYSLFGVVITSSVSFAGILLVFSFLVVPALISMQLAHNIKGQLLLGWLIGAGLCLVGMLLSYKFDLPAGAIIVVVFTVTPLIFLPFFLLNKDRI